VNPGDRRKEREKNRKKKKEKRGGHALDH